MLKDNKTKQKSVAKADLIAQFVSATEHKTEKEKIHFAATKIHLDTMLLIDEIMTSKGLKRSEVARLMGLNKSAISKYFAANEFLNLKTLAKFEKALNVKISISVTPLD